MLSLIIVSLYRLLSEEDTSLLDLSRLECGCVKDNKVVLHRLEIVQHVE